MAPSVEMPTQIQPTVPAPPSSGPDHLTPRERTPVIGGPGGGPPRPPKRPTGGGGGGGGNDAGGPGDDGARKRLAYLVGGVGLIVLVVMFALLSTSGGDDATVTSPSGLPVATQSQAKAAAASVQTTPAPGATPAPTATPAADATPAPTTAGSTSPDASSGGGVSVGGDETTPAANVPLLQSGSVTKIKSKQGDTVTFQVKSATAQEVHVHGYDNKYELAAGETKTISFKATITGIFEIEFENTSTQIGELTVEP